MIIILLVCILIYGIDFRVALSTTQNLYLIKIRIFNYFDIFTFRITIHNHKFYYKYGNKPYRLLKISKSDNRVSLLDNFPGIKLEYLKLYIRNGESDDAVGVTREWGISLIITEILHYLSKKKIEYKTYERLIMPIYDEDEFNLQLSAKIKYDILKIFFHILRTIRQNKKKRKEVNYGNRKFAE